MLRSTVAWLAAPAIAAALAIGSASGALAYDAGSPASVHVDANGVILRNFDATSHAAGTAPVEGSSDFSATVDGATYLFLTADARSAFTADPGKYKPAFAGFGATGAALGKKLDGDPRIFQILDGVLYVFVSEDAAALWDKDPAGTFAKANANWSNIHDKTPSSL